MHRGSRSWPRADGRGGMPHRGGPVRTALEHRRHARGHGRIPREAPGIVHGSLSVLSRLVARDFRNFEQLDIELPDAGIAIIGENGQGKTNLLEAVAYLSLLRSVRGARDADVVRFGASVFHVRGEVHAPAGARGGPAVVSIGYERGTKRKRASLDGVEQP